MYKVYDRNMSLLSERTQHSIPDTMGYNTPKFVFHGKSPPPHPEFQISFNPRSSEVVSLFVMTPHNLVCGYHWQILTYGSGFANGGYCSGGMYCLSFLF